MLDKKGKKNAFVLKIRSLLLKTFRCPPGSPSLLCLRLVQAEGCSTGVMGRLVAPPRQGNRDSVLPNAV
ncbi:unnamed protein product [Boreogadus saida]